MTATLVNIIKGKIISMPRPTSPNGNNNKNFSSVLNCIILLSKDNDDYLPIILILVYFQDRVQTNLHKPYLAIRLTIPLPLLIVPE